MKQIQLISTVTLLVLLAACGGGTTPTPPPTPTPGIPTLPPGTAPVTPTPVPTPTPGGVPYYGEWVITYTSNLGTSFVHALQVTDNVSTTGLRNAGGGLQEFCTGGVNTDQCEGVYGSGFGFIGELELDDGTAPLSLGIFTQYTSEPLEVKLFTVEPIVITTNAQGQKTFTATAAWVLSPNDFAPGTITATNIGAPKSLDPLEKHAVLTAIKKLRAVHER